MLCLLWPLILSPGADDRCGRSIHADKDSVGARGQGSAGSCKERKSRFPLLARAQNKRASGEALLPCLRELPPLLRQSLTLDNGSKMAGFRELERASDLLTYLCRPIHPGSAAPKGMAMPFATVFSRGHQFCFCKITEGELLSAAEWLNAARPQPVAGGTCFGGVGGGSGCACRGTLPCFFSRSERAAGLQ